MPHEINSEASPIICISFQICYTADAAAMSFLHSSCSHLQVQTVPSSAWDAPCPVVTPSCFRRLGSALSAKDNYTLLNIYSNFMAQNLCFPAVYLGSLIFFQFDTSH
jgi:hypothetical protein